MLIDLPNSWIFTLNVLVCPAIHLVVARIFLGIPATWFTGENWLFQPRCWERGGHTYEALAKVRRWKHLLPDGAPLFGGFAKKNLVSADRAYIQSFLRETCRGESAHWVMLLATPIFFLWNPLWANLVLCSYGLAANLPCIITQRYNRLRLRRLLQTAQAQQADAASTRADEIANTPGQS